MLYYPLFEPWRVLGMGGGSTHALRLTANSVGVLGWGFWHPNQSSYDSIQHSLVPGGGGGFPYGNAQGGESHMVAPTLPFDYQKKKKKKIYIYIYIYVCVCVCVCVWRSNFAFSIFFFHYVFVTVTQKFMLTNFYHYLINLSIIVWAYTTHFSILYVF